MNNTSYHNSRSMSDVLCAVQECRSKPLGDPQRIIVVLTPAGAGLPQNYRHALRLRGALLVQTGPMDRNRARFIKLVAHRTRFVPVLLANAEDWRRWRRRQPITAAQIRRRTFLMVELASQTLANN